MSFMTLREPDRWRWSHARHHTQTIIVVQDPEIASPRPPTPFLSFLGLWYQRGFWGEVQAVLMISLGTIPATDKSYVPETEWQRIILCSRIFVLVLTATLAICLILGSLLPAMLFVLPHLYGSFLHYLCAFTQHAGLDEDILDLRLYAHTAILNPAFAFLYTNMNYHVEHHMFPMVPFYNLPDLHKKIRHDCPPRTQGLFRAYRDIISTLARQLRDPSHYQHQTLSDGANPPRHHFRHAFPAAMSEA
jgi:fatty acid desaturase